MSEPHEVVVESDHMTGPDHWGEASAFAEAAGGTNSTDPKQAEFIGLGTLHALLAIGAALGLQLPADSSSGELWRRIAGYPVGDGLGESIG